MAFTKVYSVNKEVAEIYLECAGNLAKRLKEYETKLAVSMAFCMIFSGHSKGGE